MNTSRYKSNKIYSATLNKKAQRNWYMVTVQPLYRGPLDDVANGRRTTWCHKSSLCHYVTGELKLKTSITKGNFPGIVGGRSTHM